MQTIENLLNFFPQELCCNICWAKIENMLSTSDGMGVIQKMLTGCELLTKGLIVVIVHKCGQVHNNTFCFWRSTMFRFVVPLQWIEAGIFFLAKIAFCFCYHGGCCMLCSSVMIHLSLSLAEKKRDIADKFWFQRRTISYAVTKSLFSPSFHSNCKLSVDYDQEMASFRQLDYGRI